MKSVKWLTRYLVIYTIAVWAAITILPGVSWDGSWIELVVLGAIMAVAFHLLSPLVRLVFLPLNLVTLGIAGVFVNAAIFWCALQFSPVSLTIQSWQFPGWGFSPLGISLGTITVGALATTILAATIVTVVANTIDLLV